MAQKREKGGSIRANVEKEGRKQSSDGFNRGGTIKRAKGGALEKWAKEEENEPEHKRAAGGALKRKDGGSVGGAPSAPMLAYRARGGRTSAPFSSGRSMSNRGSGSSGHEDE